MFVPFDVRPDLAWGGYINKDAVVARSVDIGDASSAREARRLNLWARKSDDHRAFVTQGLDDLAPDD